jgi:hypothetical protein
MSRSLSLYRRKTNLVELLLRQRAGKTGFRFSAAPNFDAASVAFATVPNYGVRSPSVPEIGVVGSQYRDQVRFIFNPADYFATAPALVDTNPFFIQVEAQNPNGTFDAKEAMHMVLPPEMATPNRVIALSGTAPSAADISGSLEVQLPMQCIDFEFENLDNAKDLYVAFEPTGGEYLIPPLTTDGYTLAQQLSSVSQIFVRGGGASVAFRAVFTLRNNEIQ